MKNHNKILTSLILLFTTNHIAYASMPTLNLQLINHSTKTGYVATYSGGLIAQGPILKKNGDETIWKYTPTNNKEWIGFEWPTDDFIFTCHTSGGQLALNASQYQGDTIYITFTNWNDSRKYLECTCTGSACEVT